MFRVLFNNESSDYLASYFVSYREYYESLYKDSGIWSENKIIEGYISESKQRKNEIIKLIIDNISQEKILGKTLLNTIIISWRTKYIFLKWTEDKIKMERYISNIQIR